MSNAALAIKRESGDQAKEVTRATCPSNLVVCYKKTRDKLVNYGTLKKATQAG